MRLFIIRQTFLFCGLITLCATANAQLVDEILGQRRNDVSVLMRSHRIVDYKLERVVHFVGDGIHQTVFYENDTCNKFYWAVPNSAITDFTARLAQAGYTATDDKGFVKDSLKLIVEPLQTGVATLYIAVFSDEMRKMQSTSRPHKKQKRKERTNAPVHGELETMPLLQQAILAEDADTTAKPPKDPERHWIGAREGKTHILGW